MKFSKLFVYFNVNNSNKIKILYGVSDDYSVLDFLDNIAELDNYCGFSFENKPLTKEEYFLVLNKKIKYCNCIEKVKSDYAQNYESSLDF